MRAGKRHKNCSQVHIGTGIGWSLECYWINIGLSLDSGPCFGVSLDLDWYWTNFGLRLDLDWNWTNIELALDWMSRIGPANHSLQAPRPFAALCTFQFLKAFIFFHFYTGRPIVIARETRKGISSNIKIGWDREDWVPGAFKLNHLLSLKTLLS